MGRSRRDSTVLNVVGERRVEARLQSFAINCCEISSSNRHIYTIGSFNPPSEKETQRERGGRGETGGDNASVLATLFKYGSNGNLVFLKSCGTGKLSCVGQAMGCKGHFFSFPVSASCICTSAQRLNISATHFRRRGLDGISCFMFVTLLFLYGGNERVVMSMHR